MKKFLEVVGVFLEYFYYLCIIGLILITPFMVLPKRIAVVVSIVIAYIIYRTFRKVK